MSRIYKKGSSLLRKIDHLIITDSNLAWHAKKADCGVQEAILGRIPSDTYQKKGLPVQKLKDPVIRIEEFKQ
jgi:hypothetical protein